MRNFDESASHGFNSASHLFKQMRDMCTGRWNGVLRGSTGRCGAEPR
jgi:hypothetical protein